MEFLPVGLMLVVISSLLFFLYYDGRERKRLAKIWTLHDQGLYQEVIYGYDTYTTRSGAMVKHTTTHKMDITAIYFTDGRTCVIKDQRLSMPFPTGTPIWLYRNGNGKIKVLDHVRTESGSEAHS